MKSIYLVFLFLILVGCKTYIQVYETEHKKNIKVVDDNYVFENDTLIITYNFWENKGLMKFSIYNKLDVPIYIDWKKSSYIDNSVKLNYWEDTESSLMTHKSYYYSGYYGYYGTSRGTSRTTKTKEERITFIPPISTYTRAQFYILPLALVGIQTNNNSKEVPLNGSSKNKTKIYEKNFNYENTPLVFRNFLTYSLTEDFESEFYLDNEFYISKVLEVDNRHFYGGIPRYTRTDDEIKKYFYDARYFYFDLRNKSKTKKKIKVDFTK